MQSSGGRVGRDDTLAQNGRWTLARFDRTAPASFRYTKQVDLNILYDMALLYSI